MSDAEFDTKHNLWFVLAAAIPQNIVVNVAKTATYGACDDFQRASGHSTISACRAHSGSRSKIVVWPSAAADGDAQ